MSDLCNSPNCSLFLKLYLPDPAFLFLLAYQIPRESVMSITNVRHNNLPNCYYIIQAAPSVIIEDTRKTPVPVDFPQEVIAMKNDEVLVY